MSNNSTSMHTINADHPLSRFQRYCFYLFNIINNLFPYFHIDDRLVIKNFNCDAGKYWGQLNCKSSPSRKLSDLFWINLPWQKIEQELGVINIVDMGCGKGTYGKYLKQWSGERISSYTGIDIQRNENWVLLEQENCRFTFFQSGVTEFSQLISAESNFFISQSAIEHFENDLIYFKQIDEFARSNKKIKYKFILCPRAHVSDFMAFMVSDSILQGQYRR